MLAIILVQGRCHHVVLKNEYTTIEYIHDVYKESYGRVIAHVTSSPRQLLVYGATVHTNHVIRATVQPILIEDGSTCPAILLGDEATVCGEMELL